MAKQRAKQAWGTVVQIGTGTSEYTMEVKVGDRICYDNKRDYITIDDNVMIKLSDVWFIDYAQRDNS